MYGTVARLRIKPGMEGQLDEQMRAFEAAKVPGVVATYVYRMDADPNEYYLATIWEGKAAYAANATSPEQHARYQAYRALLAAEPEWHDGEIVYPRS
jgi:quinol monooxygenase YgiN